MRAFLMTAVLMAAFGTVAPVAAAVQPENDDYLSATRLEPGKTSVTSTRATADATTQSSIFGQDRSGPAEPTSCLGATYGKTVWYVFRSPRQGVTELRAAGYDTVVAIYNYDAATSALGTRVDCANSVSGLTDLFAPVRAGHTYAVQVGGVDSGQGPASGALQFTFDVYGDVDGDGQLDELDQCPRRPGVRSASGCPPRLSTTPAMRWVATGSGVRVVSLNLAGAPRGSRVALRCRRRCSLHQTVRVSRAGVVRLQRASGQTLQSGASVELRVTVPAGGPADYRYGAIGNYFRFDIRQGNLRRTDRCLLPGSNAPRRRCR